MSLETTKRFVFAHELAHVILRMPEVRHLLQMRGQACLLADEEGFADRIAATILVPDSWIEALHITRCPLKQLQDVARIAKVSVMMLVSRMASSGIDIALLHWRRGDNVWRVIDRPGVPYRLCGYVRPSVIGDKAIDNLRTEESDIVVDCHVNGQLAKIAGRGYRHGIHAFQFLEPSIDVWISSEIDDASQTSRIMLHGADES
jgi:hypothetical protein